jgi:orotate phosphoribosyltransferase
MKAVTEARERGGEVVGVITVVDRLEGARETFDKEGLTLVALFDTTDFP